MPEFTDYEIDCADCGEGFNFSGKEQAFYLHKGFNKPKRCQTCREKRKREIK